MTDLAAFLLARLAEDEAAARAAIGASDSRWQVNHTGTVVFGDEWAIADASLPTGAHIARHDPSRVLAESTALRAVVGLHAPDHECTDGSSNYPGVFAGDPALGMAPCPTLRALASTWADHPDYDPIWRT